MYVLCRAVSSQLDCSRRFTLCPHCSFRHQIGFSGKHSSLGAKTIHSPFYHGLYPGTLLYSWTEASRREQKYPNFETIAQGVFETGLCRLRFMYSTLSYRGPQCKQMVLGHICCIYYFAHSSHVMKFGIRFGYDWIILNYLDLHVVHNLSTIWIHLYFVAVSNCNVFINTSNKPYPRFSIVCPPISITST